MTLRPGTRLGVYEIASPIGAGGMGEVYRGRDPRLGRDVAIKILSASLSIDPERLRRFEQEARAIAAISHPNILAVYDIGSQEDTPYIVSELLQGQTLREHVQFPASTSSPQPSVADPRTPSMPAILQRRVPALCRYARRWNTRSRSRAASPPRMPRGSSTGT